MTFNDIPFRGGVNSHELPSFVIKFLFAIKLKKHIPLIVKADVVVVVPVPKKEERTLQSSEA